MEWIKVEDQLPEKGKEVLLWSDRYGRCFGVFLDENKHGTIWKYNGDYSATFNAPTHWAELLGKPA